MFRKRPPEPIPKPDWMIVGLGNPGPEYKRTRHNVGFEVLDMLAERHRLKFQRSLGRALTAYGTVNGVSACFVKPMTFMNLSGQAVAPLAKSMGVPLNRILVVADDLDLQLGRVRLKPKGSAGGHNGHRSLIASLGSTEYPRIKIGIDHGRGEAISHVLGTFSPKENDAIKEALSIAAEGVERVLTDGIERASSWINALRINSGEPDQ